jgi:flagellin-like protein
MKLKQLFADDDAVSPVIGVILMVAITVILAAVIGTFVLGLGDQVKSSAPSANAEFSYFNNETGTQGVNITHNGGEQLQNNTLSVSGAGISGNLSGTKYHSDSTYSTTDVIFTSLHTKDGIPLDTISEQAQLSQGQTVSLVWTGESGQKSNVIAESTVP